MRRSYSAAGTFSLSLSRLDIEKPPGDIHRWRRTNLVVTGLWLLAFVQSPVSRLDIEKPPGDIHRWRRTNLVVTGLWLLAFVQSPVSRLDIEKPPGDIHRWRRTNLVVTGLWLLAFVQSPVSRLDIEKPPGDIHRWRRTNLVVTGLWLLAFVQSPDKGATDLRSDTGTYACFQLKPWPRRAPLEPRRQTGTRPVTEGLSYRQMMWTFSKNGKLIPSSRHMRRQLRTGRRGRKR